MSEEFKPGREPYRELYIDPWTKQAFEEAGGGNYISQEELAALGQVFRSADGREYFKRLTGISIKSKEDMKKVFESAARGEINLRKVLLSGNLEKYKNRKTPFNID